MNMDVVWTGARGPAKLTAADNWANAIKTYRASVDVYRHMLILREQRRQAPPRRASPASSERGSAAPRPFAVVDTRFPKDLTRRERDVARLLTLGYSNAQIAETLVISLGTTANHVAHILAKLGVANRAQVVARLLQPAPDDGADLRLHALDTHLTD
jgi:DNA-binding NarL/FixJ family response regulator